MSLGEVPQGLTSEIPTRTCRRVVALKNGVLCGKAVSRAYEVPHTKETPSLVPCGPLAGIEALGEALSAPAFGCIFR